MSQRAPQSAGAQDARLDIPPLAGRAKMRRAIFVLALLGAGLLAYRQFAKPPEVTEQFRTVDIERRTVVQQVEAAGRVDAQNRVDVPAPSPGRLLSIHARQGEQVKAGQLLAELDPRAAALAVKGAEAAVEAAAAGLAQARAAMDAAQRAYDRAKVLVQKGLASPEAVAEAEAELAQAKAAVEAARSEQKVRSQGVASAKLGQSLSRIEAPSDGVVLSAPERIGAAVSPEAGPLFVIGDALSTMRIDATVSEMEVALLSPGQSAEVFVNALPGRTFKGKIEQVGIEPARREGAVLYPVRLSVENPDGALLPGMTVRTSTEVARAENVLSVHDAALRFTPPEAPEAPPRSRVWKRLSLTEVEPVNVKALISDGAYVQIEPENASALTEGDQVVVGLLHPEGGGAKPNITLGNKK